MPIQTNTTNTTNIADIPWCTSNNKKNNSKPITNRCCYGCTIFIIFIISIIACACALVAPTSPWLIIEHLGGNNTEITYIQAHNGTVNRYEQKEYLLDKVVIAPLCNNIAVGTKTRYNRYTPDSQEIIYQKDCSPIPINITIFDISLVPDTDDIPNTKQTSLILISFGIISQLLTLGIIIQILQIQPKGCISMGFTRSNQGTKLWILSIFGSIFTIIVYFLAISIYNSHILQPLQEIFDLTLDDTNTGNRNISYSLRYTLSTLWYRVGDGYTLIIIAGVLTSLNLLFLFIAVFFGRKWLFFISSSNP